MSPHQIAHKCLISQLNWVTIIARAVSVRASQRPFYGALATVVTVMASLQVGRLRNTRLCSLGQAVEGGAGDGAPANAWIGARGPCRGRSRERRWGASGREGLLVSRRRLELNIFLGRQTRVHGNLDIGVRRQHSAQLVTDLRISRRLSKL